MLQNRVPSMRKSPKLHAAHFAMWCTKVLIWGRRISPGAYQKTYKIYNGVCARRHIYTSVKPCMSMHRVKGSRAGGLQSTVQQRAVFSNSDFEQPFRALRCLQSMPEQLL